MSRQTDILSGSHIPVLVKLLEISDGAVLEMGMGLNSTPLLHWLCTAKERQLVSLENDPKWLGHNKAWENGFHRVEFVENWEKANIDNTHWSVVLIDHRPALRRKEDAIRLKNNANFVVVHDAEPEINRFYRYDKIDPHYKYKFLYDRVKPYTVVYSNFVDLPIILRKI